MKKAKTVGEVFDERGPCALMAKIVELAEQRRRIPVRRWEYLFTTEPGTVLYVNGEKAPWTIALEGGTFTIAPWEAAVFSRGWLIATFNTVDGAVIGRTEDDILAAFDAELAAPQNGETARDD